jgi:hypothetical protein
VNLLKQINNPTKVILGLMETISIYLYLYISSLEPSLVILKTRNNVGTHLKLFALFTLLTDEIAFEI